MNSGHHGFGLLDVVDDPVVQGTVGFDVVHGGADSMGHAVQGTELVEDIAEELIEGHVHRSAPEAVQVPVAHMGTDPDVELEGGTAAVQHGHRIPCMEAARDVGAADNPEH